MRTAETILGLIRERGKRGLPLERVYKLLFNRELYLMAYGKIYRNTGAMTHGVTDETPDGMSLKKIDASIQALRGERYQWLPARRTYIPKKNGKKRPLGMPVWSNKLVQEVIRLILEAYYEPQFSDHSHGFRPERGCQSALGEIYSQWIGTTWFIEEDIAQCFDQLDHELLLNTLSAGIHDGRFIKLMRELIDAGYMEEWTFNQTLSGVPQGGIVSPLLSNILLNQLDSYVETVLIPTYTKGVKRKGNPHYQQLMWEAFSQWQQGNTVKAEELRSQAQRLSAMDVFDPDYRRLRYVRYADDFLLGFVGPRSEAEEIKQALREFLRDTLKLELSEAKTLITHARSEAARFLGYEITTLHVNEKRTVRDTNHRGIKTKCRSVNGKVGLRIPREVIEEKCRRYKRGQTVIHRAGLIEESDYSIITTYQLEYRGIANYYRLAFNMDSLGQLKWVMEQSLTKTLARKFRRTVPQIYEKYGAELMVQGQKYKGLQVRIPRPDKKPLVATWGGIPLKRDMKATLEEQPPYIHWGPSDLIQRLLADHCELCGNTEDVQVHHVRKMKNLHEYPGRPKPEWAKRMIALRRKTLLLCRTCHEDVDHGLPLRQKLIELAEVKALQKRGAGTTILESRMP